jgi:hypothetical protein
VSDIPLLLHRISIRLSPFAHIFLALHPNTNPTPIFVNKRDMELLTPGDKSPTTSQSQPLFILSHNLVTDCSKEEKERDKIALAKGHTVGRSTRRGRESQRSRT